MPGYIIHLAIAKKYAENNHMKESSDYIKGVLMPDLLKKPFSHYTKNYKSSIDFVKFGKENDINVVYNKGYLLHLVTDYFFYTKYLQIFSKEIYREYDKLNKSLIDRYKLKIPKEVADIIRFEEGDNELLNYKTICNFIEKVAKINLEKVINCPKYLEKYKI